MGRTAKGNAIRHLSWMCNARRFWLGTDEFAIALGEAHEMGRTGTEYDEVADKINNAIALYLASTSTANCVDLAYDAWNQGMLAKNSNIVAGVAHPPLNELQEISASWDAGLNYLQQVNRAAELTAANNATIARVRLASVKCSVAIYNATLGTCP